MQHVPVLLREVLETLDPKPGETVLDVTVGLGGHASAFLREIGAVSRLVGLDADEENLRNAECKMKNEECKNVSLIHANFRDFWSLCFETPHQCLPEEAEAGAEAVSKGAGGAPQHDTGFDIIFADLGLSSPHLDDPGRGFTYSVDAPLDMRYDRTTGKTAADILNRASEVTLRDIFRNFGELREAAKLATVIVSARRDKELARSTDLREVAGRVYGKRAMYFFSQIFQALRIAVNDEIGALQSLLAEGPKMLKPGGRMGVISYHSLEDRMVKRAFRELSISEKHSLTGAALSPPLFELLTKKPIVPAEQELAENPRSRSARFRAVLKLKTRN